MKGQFLLFVYVPYNKTNQFLIYRKVQLVDLEGSRLVPSRITYVLLKEGDYNIDTVAAKVAESLNAEDETFVLLDNKNQEIQDCAATQGYSTFMATLFIFMLAITRLKSLYRVWSTFTDDEFPCHKATSTPINFESHIVLKMQ